MSQTHEMHTEVYTKMSTKMPTKVEALDGPICANRFADSGESLDSDESFQGSRTEPLFANRTSGCKTLQVAGLRRFARIIRTLWNRVFLRIDSRELPWFALWIAGPSEVEAFCCVKRTPSSPRRLNLTLLTKVCMKVCSVSSHMFYVHMCCLH